MKALVTGATGFIGSVLCDRVRQHGIDVRAAVRDAPRGAPNPSETIETGDLAQFTAWDRAVAGVDVVFHLAGLAHLPSLSRRDVERLRATNVAATERLVRAARESGVRRFVFLSTAKVFGEESGSRPWTEADPPAPRDEYARAKLDAETVVLGLLSERAVIVRPPLVYGPHVRANFLSLLRAVSRGLPVPVPAAPNRRTLIFVRNLADALQFLAMSPRSGVFVAADRECISTEELVGEIARALGREPRVIRLPRSLIRASAGLPVIGRRIRKIAGSFELDTSKLAASGWTPPHSLRHGIEETAQWFRAVQR